MSLTEIFLCWIQDKHPFIENENQVRALGCSWGWDSGNNQIEGNEAIFFCKR